MVVAPIFITGPRVRVSGLSSNLDPPLECRGDELVVEDALQHSEMVRVTNMFRVEWGVDLRAGHLLLSGCYLCGSVMEYAGELLQASRE